MDYILCIYRGKITLDTIIAYMPYIKGRKTKLT